MSSVSVTSKGLMSLSSCRPRMASQSSRDGVDDLDRAQNLLTCKPDIIPVAACAGPVAACASGWGVIEPTTLTLEVTCKKCQPGEYSDPVKREDLFPSYSPFDNDIDIIYPICKA